MSATSSAIPPPAIERVLPKAPTGIEGLDEITGGGLPRERPTLVCGTAGCGKTLLGIEFLVRGATQFGEPGVLVSFEESAHDLAQNVASLGFDLDGLVASRQLVIDHIRIERSEIEETGAYDLEGLFLRLGHAIDTVGAKRVVLDTLEALFGGLSDHGLVRAELRRLFGWLKERGVTAVITAERGTGALTRHGLEEYVSDCVILLDQRIVHEVATRRLRIVKYRGSSHGTSEYPFLIDEAGISVLPLSAARLDHAVGDARVSTGIERLDAMFGGQGYYAGSSILVSGTAGVGKTTLAAHFVDASCRRGERCLYFAFEESPDQICRNMRSIGIDLQRWRDAGLLKIHSVRPSLYGLEMHLATMHRIARRFRPQAVIVDPISNLETIADGGEVHSMLVRLVDWLKGDGITTLLTSLTKGGAALEATGVHISSLVDTWLLLRDIELGGERNRGLYVLKSRGMPHSNQIREFVIGPGGVELLDTYLGPEGVLTGSMRLAQEAREAAAEAERQREVEQRKRALERRRGAIEARISALREELSSEEDEVLELSRDDQRRGDVLARDRERMARSRRSDDESSATGNGQAGDEGARR